MFDKRLLAMVPEARKYIAGNVGLQWIALAANIALMISFGWFLQSMLLGMATAVQLGQLLGTGALVIAVRVAAQTGAQRMGLRASGVAKRAIRQSVYEKLLRLGPAYAKSIPTNEAVQISTEGVEQLEVYFGLYLPQFFYAVLAPSRCSRAWHRCLWWLPSSCSCACRLFPRPSWRCSASSSA